MNGHYRLLQLIAAALVPVLLLLNSCSNTKKQTVSVYCAAGLSKAASEIGEHFEKKYGFKE